MPHNREKTSMIQSENSNTLPVDADQGKNVSGTISNVDAQLTSPDSPDVHGWRPIETKQMSDILEDLANLYKQATTERSHYYVASCCKRAAEEISKLRNDRDGWKRACEVLTAKLGKLWNE